MAEAWSKEEIELITADYLAMLRAELAGETYSKAEHRRALLGLLNNRSEQSIEWKHRNITAVLLESNLPTIDGYKPAWNYQRYQFPEIVIEHAREDTGLFQAIEATVERQIDAIPSVDDILRALVDPPERRSKDAANEASAHALKITKIDYVAREAANQRLGRSGEEFVLNFEKARLIAAGADSLADRIEHVSVERGDGLGYDIRSFEPDGMDRFIEVKTTRFSRYTPFYVTPRELEFSHQEANRYRLYRVFHYSKNPALFALAGNLDRHVALTAAQFIARL